MSEAFNPADDIQKAIDVLKRLDRRQPWWPHWTRLDYYYEEPAVRRFLVPNRLVRVWGGHRIFMAGYESGPRSWSTFDGDEDYCTIDGCNVERTQRVIDGIVELAKRSDPSQLTITRLLEFAGATS